MRSLCYFHTPAGRRSSGAAATTIALLALFASPLGAPPTRAASSPPLPEGWVTIHSKGQSFIMGQEFPGKRWTYTFPAHPVSFTYDFALCATQVTQADYKKVAGANPTLHPGNDLRPIDNVSWFDAVLFCNALSKRDGLDAVYTYSDVKKNATNQVTDLPGLSIDIKKNGYRLLTSAEYEFVQRAGSTNTWFFAATDADQKNATNYGWCELNATNKHTHPVAQLKPNKFGVYDITGNLWMWCNDWYVDAPYPDSPQVDQTGPAAGRERIARGAAFKNDINHQRSAYHWQWAPSDHNYEVGFRIARTVQ